MKNIHHNKKKKKKNQILNPYKLSPKYSFIACKNFASVLFFVSFVQIIIFFMLLPAMVVFYCMRLSICYRHVIFTTVEGWQHVTIFSHHQSLDGVNHLITFEANHLLSATAMHPVSNPDLHTSPQEFEIRYSRLRS